MPTPKWTIPEHCIFRVEEDGNGFMFNADTDGVHPLNRTGILVLQNLNGDTESEKDIFDRIWPQLEESVKESVRDDISKFLKDLCEKGCLIDGEAEAETNTEQEPEKAAAV